jgi:uncharacterized protein YcgI (DUF1989 family)
MYTVFLCSTYSVFFGAFLAILHVSGLDIHRYCIYKSKRVKDERNILHKINRRTPDWFGHMLRSNCLLKNVIERKIEGTGHEEEDVRSYSITLRKLKDTGN